MYANIEELKVDVENLDKRKFDDRSAAAADQDPLGLAASGSQSLGLRDPLSI